MSIKCLLMALFTEQLQISWKLKNLFFRAKGSSTEIPFLPSEKLCVTLKRSLMQL